MRYSCCCSSNSQFFFFQYDSILLSIREPGDDPDGFPNSQPARQQHPRTGFIFGRIIHVHLKAAIFSAVTALHAPDHSIRKKNGFLRTGCFPPQVLVFIRTCFPCLSTLTKYHTIVLVTKRLVRKAHPIEDISVQFHTSYRTFLLANLPKVITSFGSDSRRLYSVPCALP